MVPDASTSADGATEEVRPSSGADPPQPDDSPVPSPADAAPADPVEARLEDALERVAHGATVSIPSILLERGLMVAFTAVLTNGFAAGSYGLFALARRFQRYAGRLSAGFGQGLSRYLPAADSAAERDLVATFASVLLLSVATVFGAALFVAAPTIARVTGQGPTFELFLRVFAAGTPVAVWLYAVAGMLRAFEEVGALNLTLRVGFPLAQLAVAVLGVVLLEDLAAVAGGVVAATALVSLAATAWLVRERGLRPRLRGPEAGLVRRQYLSFTVPLFLAGFATTTQRLGFYPLIAWFLSGTAGGVFAVGVLVGGLVRLPLMGINQFIPPVAAALHEEGHHDALARLYHVTSRLVLVGVTALATPALVYREPVMAVFGPTFVRFAWLLPGFVLAQYGACAAGSVGILLAMTDNQRAMLVTNVLITAVLVVTAVPLTATYGLPGLVGSYLLMLALNNGLEVAVLYHLEGLQPFTRLHAKPLVAAVPFAAVALAVRATLPPLVAAVVGSFLGVTVYAGALHILGFTRIERRLGATLLKRYRAVLRGALDR